MGLIGSKPVAEKQETQLFWDPPTPTPALPKVKASPNSLLAEPGGLNTHQPPLSTQALGEKQQGWDKNPR